MATIKETSNYSLFEYYSINRSTKNDGRKAKKHSKVLEASMIKHGFLDSKAIMVKRNHRKKLIIICGHHRFKIAKKLGIPVKYIIEKEDVSIYELEESHKSWDLQDHLISNIKAGKHSYDVVGKYRDRTGIGLNCCVALLAGESAGSNNFLDRFKSGRYQLGCPDHSSVVGDLILHFKKSGISFATIDPFVKAISKISWVEELDIEIFKKKITTFSHLVEKQASLRGYVVMFDMIHNKGN